MGESQVSAESFRSVRASRHRQWRLGKRQTFGFCASLLLLASVVVLLFQSQKDDNSRGAAIYSSTDDGIAQAPALVQGDASGGVNEESSDAFGTSDAPATNIQTLPNSFDRKVIRTANVAVSVQNVDQAIGYVRDVAVASGGFVFSSSTAAQGDATVGQIVIQVPFTQFDSVMNQLRNAPGLDKLLSENSSSQDVTSEYVDSASRIRNLQATEQGYLALLDKAIKVEDILLVQSHLSDVRGEIETLQGRLKYLDNVTAYSTITVGITPVAATPIEKPTGNPLADAVRDAWDASLTVAGGLTVALLSVLVFSWWLLPMAAIGYAIYRHRRGRIMGAPSLS